MLNNKQLRKIFQNIQVVRPPKRRLSTFGSSKIEYVLVTDVPGFPDRSRLRLGSVTAEKPALITPQSIRELFQGFSPEANEYTDSLINHYGKALRGLEYQFRNESSDNRVELTPPQTFIRNLADQFDREQAYNKALLQGTEKLWEMSIMKFIVEETLSSFSINLQELQERGFFDEDHEEKRQQREIQNLIRKAKLDKSIVPLLGSKLKEYKLFDQYQDTFFSLIQK